MTFETELLYNHIRRLNNQLLEAKKSMTEPEETRKLSNIVLDWEDYRHLRASHDRLLIVAKLAAEIIDMNLHNKVSHGEEACYLDLRAAIAAAEEIAP